MLLFGEDQNATTWFDLVQELFPNDTNVEELAETLRNRIAEGEINLVIVCDCIPPGVPDVVSGIASQETLAFDLDLVEVRPFVRDGDDAKEILFVPTTRLATEIVSRTAVSVTYREGDQQPSTDVKIIHASEADERGERLWSPEEVERDFLKLEDSTALEILEFAKQHSADGKFTPMGRRKLANICFYINDHSADGKKTRLPLFSTTCTWNCVYFNLKNVSRFSDESVDREFRSRLANLFDTNVEPDATWVGIGFDSISSSIDEFKELVLWFVANMKVTE